MSLGTGALKVGWEPECLRHSKKVSMATLQGGTTPVTSHWKTSVENTHLTPILTNAEKGRDGLGARICKDSLKQQIRKDQLKNAYAYVRMLEEEIADHIGLQFNFA